MTDYKKPAKTAFSSFLLHLHPRTVPAETIRFTLSFGLGGMAAALLLVLMVTGILQLLSYAPETTGAYQSVQRMYTDGSLAGFVRNSHYWSGNGLVIVVFLHMLRVFLTGALVDGREYNWVIGTMLFGLVLFANFTGYLMPWDQLAFWAVTIFTSMISYIPVIGEQMTELLRGGGEVGKETLANFFAIHVGIVPVLIILFAVWHFWMIRKAGGLVKNRGEGEEDKKWLATVPHLIYREAAVGFGLVALVLLFSAFFEAPLGEAANPGQSPNPTKAAWYFMGLQELLLHLHPLFALFVVPLLMVGVFLSLPFIKGAVLPGGYWFGGKNGRLVGVMSFLAGVLLITVAVILDDLYRNGATAQSGWLIRGAFPLLAYCLSLACIYTFLTMKTSCSRAQAVMALVLYCCGSIIGLTVIGTWFRGPEMALMLLF